MSKKSERAKRRRMALLVLGTVLMLGAPAAEARRLRLGGFGGTARVVETAKPPVAVPIVVPVIHTRAAPAQDPAGTPAPAAITAQPGPLPEPAVEKVAMRAPVGPRAAVPVMGSAMRVEPAPTGFKPLN